MDTPSPPRYTDASRQGGPRGEAGTELLPDARALCPLPVLRGVERGGEADRAHENQSGRTGRPRQAHHLRGEATSSVLPGSDVLPRQRGAGRGPVGVSAGGQHAPLPAATVTGFSEALARCPYGRDLYSKDANRPRTAAQGSAHAPAPARRSPHEPPLPRPAPPTRQTTRLFLAS